ncbi:MAG: twin-arginine translocation signal domain-containing protein [Thermoleophilaceae bacterium]
MQGDLSRRDFLERTAYAAGLTGMAGPPSRISESILR